jgi:hypothetical protein
MLGHKLPSQIQSEHAFSALLVSAAIRDTREGIMNGGMYSSTVERYDSRLGGRLPAPSSTSSYSRLLPRQDATDTSLFYRSLGTKSMYEMGLEKRLTQPAMPLETPRQYSAGSACYRC